MKKLVLTAAALALTAGAAYAAPTLTTTPGHIVGSKHDMSLFNASADKTEICIYCHTPHNAVINVPLWNRHNPSPTLFTLYNSPTLSNAKTAALTTASISLFCMSCHDGNTALGDVQNKNIVTGNSYGIQISTGAAPVDIGGSAVIPSNTVENARLGNNLQNTHPIGFDFVVAQSNDSGLNAKSTILTTFEDKKRVASATGLYPAATSAQDFLYGPGNNMFECASCHRVHDPGLSGNFLRIENDKSQLCLACHNK